MKKREFSINYQKKWSNDGSCYKQTINITERTFENLQGKLQAELVLPRYKIDDCYARLYLKSPLERVGNIVFMNLTQRDFFNKYLKLKLLDVNTCFCIIEIKKSKSASKVLQFMDEGLSYGKAITLVVYDFKNKLEKELESYI